MAVLFACLFAGIQTPPPGRQACRQAGMQACRQAGMQAGRHAGRQAGMQAGRHAGRQAGRQAGMQAGRHAGRQAAVERPVTMRKLNCTHRTHRAHAPSARTTVLPPTTAARGSKANYKQLPKADCTCALYCTAVLRKSAASNSQ